MNLDELDIKIINLLLDNSKYSYKDIAEKCNVTNVTILNRIKRLEDKDYIKGYSINPDYERLGLEFQTIIEFKARFHSRELKDLFESKEISHVFRTTGDADVTIIARFKTKSAMNGFLKRLREQESIEKMNTKIILENVKEGGSSI